MTPRIQPREANPWTKFQLLMWKNFLQQWRHKGQTVAELLIPVVTMTMLLVLRSQIDPIIMGITSYPAIPAKSLDDSRQVIIGMNLSRISLGYSPRSPILEEVVRNAAANILLQNSEELGSILEVLLPGLDLDNANTAVIQELLRNIINVTAFENSAALRGIYVQEQATREILAVVEFDDSLFGATQLPLHLSYALRFPEKPRMHSFYGQGSSSWRTGSLFPSFEIAGPRAASSASGGLDPGYVSEMFIALQHMVSTELILRVSEGNFTNFDINIQRYPHPPYILDFVTEALQFLFPMFIMLSFCYTVVNIVRAITLEKELQLKEAMKIMGLSTWLHWTAWFCKQFIHLLIATIFIIILLTVPWFTAEDGETGYAVFSHTPWSVLFFFMILYLTCTIFFCFMLSGFFSKASTAALFTGVIWFLTYIPAFLLSLDVSMSIAAQVITCLSINSAMAFGVQLILARESTGGLQWGEFMMSSTTDSPRLLFGQVLIMLAVNCVLYMMIALYLEQVLPGPYGTPKSWYFFVQKDFWFDKKKNRIEGSDEAAVENGDVNDNIIKEKDPIDLPVGVKMKNLTKIYGSNKAVNNLNLNIYDDQITVLLGHNGAGKSTTISMLTGNVAITSGSVTVAGYDISKQTRLARSHLGFCPQHNVLFNSLTVKEHLSFFAQLKGFKGRELKDEIETMIAKLELEEKANYQAHGLSGGQKRRLAVGIALCGGARVVLLDEPTSGMDPASRRALWDLLQKEKKGRSMILTTHFMDEADILGDRVAIMAEGQLQCVGSPFFLKRHYGVGYTLVVVKKEGFRIIACTDLINNYIPGTVVKEDRGTEATYTLKGEYSHLFEPLLSDLEANQSFIRFENYGLIATTLEDVFMSVGSDVQTELDDSIPSTPQFHNGNGNTFDFHRNAQTINIPQVEVTGIRLIWQHTLAIWFKLGLVWIKSWPLLTLQILIPLAQLMLSLGILQYASSFTEPIVRKELTLSTGYVTTETLLSFNGTPETIGSSAKEAYENMFATAEIPSMELTIVDGMSLDEYYLGRTQDFSEMAMLRNKILIGASFEDNSATAWFSNFGYHDVANSLAAVHAALLKTFNSEASITVFNHPIEASYEEDTNMNLMVSLLSMQLASAIGTSLGIVSAVFIMFYIKERVSRAKLLQKAAGIQPVIMWFSAAIFDWLYFCLISLTIIISCVIFGTIGLSSVDELGRLYLCMIIYGAGMLPINYVCSFLFNGPAVGFVVMFFTNVLLGMMGPQIVDALWTPGLHTHAVADVLDAILQFFPLYGLVTNVRLLNQVGVIEWSCLQNCDYMMAVMPNVQECTMQVMCENFSEQCCLPEKPWWYWNDPGVVRYLTTTLITMVVMWVVLMIAEYRLVQKVFNREKKAPLLDYNTLDIDVKDEMCNVERIATGKSHSLVAKGLTKYYGKNLAVDQVAFTVSDTECFGLLGVNGAGKTTTFKMLMGDETISSGDAFVAGHSVKTNISRVFENIGYCPQFDVIFNELTGRQTLRLFSMLRGLSQANARLEAEDLAQSLGFMKHIDKRVEHYSGGNKRKLSTAIALLGRTRLVFVDEPTTGVDPAAKRQVWNAIQEARRNRRGVVLTSHSMEECEALCSRLTIMVNGRFQCLGTPQHLKNKFSEGFTLTIKLKHDDSNSMISHEANNTVKRYVTNNFRDAKIMEEYQGLITYYLPDKTMPWSRMFGIMEKAKQEIDIEDYSISQTSLEQIFLQFTKYQRTQ